MIETAEKSLMTFEEFQKLTNPEMTQYKQLVIYRVNMPGEVDNGQIRRLKLQACGRIEYDILDENLKTVEFGRGGQHGVSLQAERELIGLDLLRSLDDIIEYKVVKR